MSPLIALFLRAFLVAFSMWACDRLRSKRQKRAALRQQQIVRLPMAINPTTTPMRLPEYRKSAA